MQQLGKAFLLGLATVVPVALTLYLVYVLGIGAERLMGSLLKLILPAQYYWPGLGVILAIIAITVVGLLVRLPWLGLLVRLGDTAMSRIPLVKTVYSTIRDFTELVTSKRASKDIGRPVTVRLWDEVELIGLVTDEHLDDERVLVYLPMSYQLGGYALALSRDRLENIDMSIEDALRYVLTAGIQSKRPPRSDTSA